HCHMYVVPDGPHQGALVDEPEYEGLSGVGSVIGCTDPVAVTWLNTQVDRAGVDVNEFGWLCGWVMECQEKGYLTPEACGLAVPWGDAEAANRLLWLVARREGFGDVLAEGVKRAAQHVGGPAYNCAVFTHKGQSPRGHDHRGRWEEMLDTAVASAGTITTGPLALPVELGIPARRNPFDPVQVAQTVGKGLGRRLFEDSLGTCLFTTRISLEHVARALSTATGWSFTFDEALIAGRRIAAILRAFNLRCGIGPELEQPSPRYGSTPTDGPNAGIAVAPHWQLMRETYYRTIGYDPATTRPLPETLRALGLDALIPVLWG
ncbi:MAG: aldehyde ferredoxin oxidoreductase C-terminal domain-containing protein, partial [Chloroflexi bacterium]|nr:aldehyde ferredoxin oxidoreductase C-terminal domain-containing protein [Chloroflexota bacterium]